MVSRIGLGHSSHFQAEDRTDTVIATIRVCAGKCGWWTEPNLEMASTHHNQVWNHLIPGFFGDPPNWTVGLRTATNGIIVGLVFYQWGACARTGLSQLLKGWKGHEIETTIRCSPRYTRRKLIWKWNSQDWKDTVMSASQDWLNPLCHNTGPTSSFNMFFFPSYKYQFYYGHILTSYIFYSG